MQAQRNKYLETTVQTASPAQLLIMLCNGAIKFCKLGMEAIENKEYAEANRHLVRAQDIVQEFRVTLNRNIDIAQNLDALYDYFNRRLIEANVQKQTEPVQEVIGFLTELKEAWAEAAKSVPTAGDGGVKYG